MRIDVFTIFPEYLAAPLARVARRARARRRGCSTFGCTTRATYATDAHRTVDDAPFGGGAGMVMMPEPLFAAVEAVQPPRPSVPAVGGRAASTRRAARARGGGGFSLLCGRYEGVDQRVADHCCE